MISIAAEIREFCIANADASLKGRYANYIKEGYDAYGLCRLLRNAWKPQPEPVETFLLERR